MLKRSVFCDFKKIKFVKIGLETRDKQEKECILMDCILLLYDLSVMELLCVSFLQLLQIIVITTVCFKCTAGPSIISNDRIWAIVKKVTDHWPIHCLYTAHTAYTAYTGNLEVPD